MRRRASAPSSGSGGKARAAYEFGCKVSVITPVTKPTGGRFVRHAEALWGTPFDGHTSAAATPPSFARRRLLPPPLGPVIGDLEKLTGVEVRRIPVDKGDRGHAYPNRFRVFISGQVRRVTKAIRREMRRRAAIAPVIGHLKSAHRMGRNDL